MSRNAKILLVSACIAVIALGAVLIGDHHRSQRAEPTASRKIPRYWFDPMHPEQHFDKPGRSPFMDMQLVPKFDGPEAGGTATPDGAIAVDPRIVQTLGVRLATVVRADFARIVDTVGLVEVDEHRIEAIQVREAGWAERLEVRAVGDSVRRGQLLAGVYSPNLLATQQEFLIARRSADPTLIEAARRRLALFGLSESQLARIARSGRVERQIAYYAPFDGYVMQLGVRQGAAVEPGTTLFQLADLASVWISAEVPEAQAAWIKAGDRAQAAVPALPGEHFEARVDYVYPDLSQATRTLKVRLVVQNPRGSLRPGMFATTELRGTPLTQALSVPSEALITTGSRSIVILAEDGTHFRPVQVRVGFEHAGRSQILQGLAEGQTVVASGQFLLDSEANLRGAFEHLAGAGTGADDADR